jgi:tetratricopeptide (TPR) repeat protein
MGDVLEAEGKHEEALAAYNDSLGIKRVLTDQNPSNATLRGGLCINLEKVGDVMMAQNKVDDALRTYQETLGIRRKLADRDPSNALWKRGLCSSLEKMGNAFMGLGNADEAQKVYQEALEIRKTLADQDTSNLSARLDLSTVLEKLHAFLARKNRKRISCLNGVVRDQAGLVSRIPTISTAGKRSLRFLNSLAVSPNCKTKWRLRRRTIKRAWKFIVRSQGQTLAISKQVRTLFGSKGDWMA